MDLDEVSDTPLVKVTGEEQKTVQVASVTLALVGMVGLADWFFYGHAPGLSVAIFVIFLAAVVQWLSRAGLGQFDRLGAVVLLVAILPSVVAADLLGLTFAGFGLGFFVLRTHRLGEVRHVGALLRFVLTIPISALRDLPKLRQSVTTLAESWGGWAKTLRNWALPVVVGILFSLLLVLSNPLFQSAISQIFDFDLKPGNLALRLVFWLLAAAFVWPFLVGPKSEGEKSFAMSAVPMHGFNVNSVRNSLFLFNALFLVQTVTDLIFLWGHGSLPAGVSPAEYAHRGAYPLVLTALLAGAFALAARPYAAQSSWLRGLLLLFVGQNVLLVISAIYRLKHYVDAFGLTGLRLSAGIWMGVVACGLLLTAWQIVQQRDNLWLMRRCGVLGVGTLYLSCFLNFAAVIAETNLARATAGYSMARLDDDYLCGLGADAGAVIRRYERQLDLVLCPHFEGTKATGWREWGLRRWWVENSEG